MARTLPPYCRLSRKISLADLIARDNVQTVALPRQNSVSLDSALLSVTGI